MDKRRANDPNGAAGADDTGRKQRGAPFQPGQSGNPSGRPKGARSRLSEAFLAEFHTDWEEHGKAVIAAVREQRPHEYLRVAASLIPKQIGIEPDSRPYRELSDEELTAIILKGQEPQA